MRVNSARDRNGSSCSSASTSSPTSVALSGTLTPGAGRAAWDASTTVVTRSSLRGAPSKTSHTCGVNNALLSGSSKNTSAGSTTSSKHTVTTSSRSTASSKNTVPPTQSLGSSSVNVSLVNTSSIVDGGPPDIKVIHTTSTTTTPGPAS
ncbi:unnamed protein product, partial [Amoebophrya sp. A25]|eukprot:GSA25T00004226001.1